MDVGNVMKQLLLEDQDLSPELEGAIVQICIEAIETRAKNFKFSKNQLSLLGAGIALGLEIATGSETLARKVGTSLQNHLDKKY